MGVIKTPLPELLQQPPFATYTLPQDPGTTADPPDPGTYFPYTTERNPRATITQNLQDFGVPDDITTPSASRGGARTTPAATRTSRYRRMTAAIRRSARRWRINVSSYDPVFWFLSLQY